MSTKPQKAPAAETMVLPFSIYRKVSKSGRCKYLTVSKIIPDNWNIVEITVTELKDDIEILRIRRLR